MKYVLITRLRANATTVDDATARHDANATTVDDATARHDANAAARHDANAAHDAEWYDGATNANEHDFFDNDNEHHEHRERTS